MDFIFFGLRFAGSNELGTCVLVHTVLESEGDVVLEGDETEVSIMRKL